MLIAGKIFIPESEFEWHFTQSAGPGGQNVNKVATAVRLVFNLRNSPSIPEQFRDLLLARLAGKMNEAGELVVSAREERTQLANRRIAMQKLDAMIAGALIVRRKRVATRPSAGSVRRRLESKAIHAQKKAARTKPDGEE